ncbi:hypothetical protein [Streptomyces sp. NPDC002573]|uniref:hypothetical protein n=1 Tax=Streptomyces sp. NPDC002573 TaxID=3364651 RepID=UPI00368EAF6A
MTEQQGQISTNAVGVIDFDVLSAGTETTVIPVAASDGVVSRGFLYARGGERTVVVVVSHPRGDMSRHYAAPAVLEAGYAFYVPQPRSLNNDVDCEHERLLLDLAAGLSHLKNERGYEKIVLLGNSGDGSLLAFYQQQASTTPPGRLTDTAAGEPLDLNAVEMPSADGLVLIAAHPGQGSDLPPEQRPPVLAAMAATPDGAILATRTLHRATNPDNNDSEQVHDCGRYATAQRYWSYGIYAASEAGQPDRGVEIVTRMSHQMIYLGHPADALGLLDVAAKKAALPATRALVASQTGRVHAALGDEQSAERHLGAADDLVAGDLGDVPEWVAYFDAAEHAGARAVSARDLTGIGRPRRASDHFTDALALRRPGFDRVKVMDRIGLAAALFTEGEPEQAAAQAHQALDEAARVDSTLVASRFNTLLDAARPYQTAAVDEVRTRAADLAAARPTTVAA